MRTMERSDLYDSLAALADQGRREDTYVWFREHQDRFSRRDQRLIRAALSGKLWRAPVLLAAVTLVFQVTAGGLFENQLQDMFSFLGRFFRPYMYVASAVPLIVNFGLAVLLAVQCYERLVFTFRMFGKRPLWGRAGAAWALTLLLAGWSVWSLVPYARDLPLVMAGEWRTGIVTEEQVDATARNNVLVEMGREPEGEYDPIPWYANPRWSRHLMPIMPGLYNRWVCDIHVDGVTCRMGRLQFDLTDYEANTYPIRVDYLPHSKLVLWISCGEG